MLSAGIFIGDELSAAGYRLAGMDVRVPAPGKETDCLEQALKEAEARIVLVSSRFAKAIAPPVLEDALALLSPLVIVVPGRDGTRLASEPANKVRRILGLET